MKSFRVNRILPVCWCAVSIGMLLFIALASENDRTIAIQTLGLGLAAAMIAIPIGAGLAWLCLSSGWMSRLVLLLTLSLLVVPVFLHVSMWDAAFGRLGWLTSTEGQVLIPLVSGWSAAAWIHGIAAAPQVAVLLLIGFTTGRRTFEEQALLDASRWGVFWHVTIRRFAPLLMLAMLWTILTCSREIAATDLYQIGTLAEQIYLGFSLGQINALGGNWTEEQLAAAGNLNPNLTIVCLLWLAVTATWIFFSLTQVELFADQQKPGRSRDWPGRPDNFRIGKSLVGLLLIVLMALIPLGNLLVRCCYCVRPIDGIPTAGYSAAQLMTTLQRASTDYTNEFYWSLTISFVSALTILCLAVIIAWLARTSKTWQLIFTLTLALSCAIPGPMIGSAIIQVFAAADFPLSRWFYDRTILAPVIANVCFCWPLASLIVWFLFRRIAVDALEHSELEGAGQPVRFIRFGLGGNLTALCGCLLISTAFCFGELSASQLVLPPGIDTIPRLMLGLLHAGVDEMTAALTLVSTGIIFLTSFMGWKLIRRQRVSILR